MCPVPRLLIPLFVFTVLVSGPLAASDGEPASTDDSSTGPYVPERKKPEMRLRSITTDSPVNETDDDTLRYLPRYKRAGLKLIDATTVSTTTPSETSMPALQWLLSQLAVPASIGLIAGLFLRPVLPWAFLGMVGAVVLAAALLIGGATKPEDMMYWVTGLTTDAMQAGCGLVDQVTRHPAAVVGLALGVLAREFLRGRRGVVVVAPAAAAQ